MRGLVIFSEQKLHSAGLPFLMVCNFLQVKNLLSKGLLFWVVDVGLY